MRGIILIIQMRKLRLRKKEVIGARWHCQERVTNSRRRLRILFFSHCTMLWPVGLPIKRFLQGEHPGVLHLTSIRSVAWGDTGNLALEGAASVRDRGKLALDQNSGVTVWGNAASWLLPWRVPTEAPPLSSVARSLSIRVFTAQPAQGWVRNKKTQKAQLLLIMESRCLCFSSAQNSPLLVTSVGSFSSS